MGLVQRNTRVIIEARGGRRLERPVYPLMRIARASSMLLFAAIIRTNTDAGLAVCSNRLEIVSPGRLPNGTD